MKDLRLEEKKKPFMVKLRHQDTIKKGPRIFVPLKGKGSYRRQKYHYGSISEYLRKAAAGLKETL